MARASHGTRAIRLLSFALISGTIATVTAVAAPAANSASVQVDFNQPTQVSVEYGEFWSFVATATPTHNCSLCRMSITLDGAAYGEPIPFYNHSATPGSGVPGTGSAYFGPSWTAPPLAPGTHAIVAEFADGYGIDSGKSTTPATLTITPAKVGIDLRVSTDPNDTSNAVISAALTGRFVDAIDPDYRAVNLAALPAGTWKLTVVDESGETTFETVAEQPAGANPFLTAYWQNVPRGTVYKASASFAPSAASAGNFAITNVEGHSYTSPSAADQPGEIPTTDPEATIASTGPTMPVWGIGAAGILALVLITAIILLLVNLRRTRPLISGVVTEGNANGN